MGSCRSPWGPYKEPGFPLSSDDSGQSGGCLSWLWTSGETGAGTCNGHFWAWDLHTLPSVVNKGPPFRVHTSLEILSSYSVHFLTIQFDLMNYLCFSQTALFS